MKITLKLNESENRYPCKGVAVDLGKMEAAVPSKWYRLPATLKNRTEIEKDSCSRSSKRADPCERGVGGTQLEKLQKQAAMVLSISQQH